MADFVAAPAEEHVPAGREGAGKRADRLLRNIDRIGNSLLAVRPMDELLDEVVGLAADILKPERVALLLDEGGRLEARAVWQSGKGGSDDIVVSSSIAREAMENKCSLLVGDASSDDRFRMQESIVNLKIHSAMVAPLWSGEEVIGILYVDNRTGIVPFTEEDLRLATLLAHLSAVKIRETLAFEELQEKQRMEQEMSYAADIQRGLLPSGKLCSSGYCIAGLNESSLEVGGDYFDYFEVGGRIWVALGDVSGKGMSAALLMSAVHASFRALVDAGLSLEHVIDRLNSGVYRDSGPAQFITLFVMVIDPEKDEIRLANAGHNPGFLARATGEVEQLEAGGLMVGAFPDLACETATTSLGPGESILLYSDGITEAFNEKGEEYGEERTIDFLKENSGPDTESFVEALLESAKDFTAGARLGDDLTAVIVRRES
jgi:sigma-B regulation protein RsbU (phosphoserine phosphatase)